MGQHYIFATSSLLKTRKKKKKKEAFPAAASMTLETEDINVEDVPATLTSFVWAHFGYLGEMVNNNRGDDIV